jgi:hypothetical protein
MNSKNFREELSIGNPGFPGTRMAKNISVEDVRSFIKRQKRLKGFSFTVPTGSSSFNIDLSGTAKIFLGIAAYSRDKDGTSTTDCCQPFQQIETVQLTINNEIVIDQLDPNFVSFALQDNEYYYLPRPLNGTDTITFNFTNPGAAENFKLVVYYI